MLIFHVYFVYFIISRQICQSQKLTFYFIYFYLFNMSSILSAEISATCNALGYLDEKTNKYYADANTLETVKDLIRYLRRDDENHSIRRQLGQTKILQTDLLPLLKSYHNESDLFDVLLRLIMNLTTPPLLLFDFEIPADIFSRNLYLEMEDHLKTYKEAFVDDGIWAVFSTHLSKILEIDHAERGDENSVKIERILVLIRNVLFVPSDAMEKRPDNDASLHDQVLWALHHSGLLDIILYITTNPVEQSYYMYILEIMFFMLREQQPHELANAALERSQSEKIRDEAELVTIRNIELIHKQSKVKKYTGTRHSRFGGTYVVKSMKSISDLELISHKPLNKLESFDFDCGKRKKKTPKHRSPLTSNVVERRSAFSIRLFLKEFCIEFLNGAYNTMMLFVKSLLIRSADNVHDESYYFWAINFFMSFNRSYKFEIKLVSETLSVQTFHYIQQQGEKYFDLMKTDKKKLLIWSRRLHIALLSYKELFLTLLAMDKSLDENVKQSSKVIKSNIFYVPEYREFVLTLLIVYDELKVTDLYLNDLMETQHLFLKMFEGFYKEEGSIVVRKKSKGKHKKKSRVNDQAKLNENLNNLWDKVSPQLSAVLESGGDFLTEEVPFDAALDIPIDEQKINAMKKIQHKLRQSEFENSISIMRMAREVWPENNFFGSDNMTSEEEFLALREVFFTDFGKETAQPLTCMDNDDDEEEEDEDDQEIEATKTFEVNLNFRDFLERLCHPKVVRACGIALRSFDTNSVNTNHAIIKLMHRIAFDCKMYVLMFQVSLFRTFQRIFKMKDFPQYKELVKFCIFIMRQFYIVAQKNDKIFIECLFWKSKKETFEIENNYISNECTKFASFWSEEEENELSTLVKEYKDKSIVEDIVDWIIKNLVNNTRSRRMVLKKLKEMDLLNDYKPTKHSCKWTAEEETQLTELYNQHKGSSDAVDLILSGLNTKRSKYLVLEKMLALGLIQNKKELRKKKENTKCKPKRKSSTVVANKRTIRQFIYKNLNAGRRDGLEWLRDNFSDAIEDFEENISIPLVTLSENIENLVENLEFQMLLKAFGIAEPYDEQERYWRIPENIKLKTLENHLELLTIILDNENPDYVSDSIENLNEREVSLMNSQNINNIEVENKNIMDQIDYDLENSKSKKKSTVIANKNVIKQLIYKNLNAGRQDGLVWLKENFSDAIEDFEENIGIPLVTLSENIENFMENSEFQTLLKAFGLAEPFNEQECYWRIPENIKLDSLKNHLKLLTSILDNDNSDYVSDSNEYLNEREVSLENLQNIGDVEVGNKNIGDQNDLENSKSKLNKKSSTVITDKNLINQLIHKNLNAGRQAGLEWLKDNLSDAIEDFEENLSVPLITLSENIQNFMKNVEFQILLKAFGIVEPFDEKEHYWRIPENIKLDTLKYNLELLTLVLDNDNPDYASDSVENLNEKVVSHTKLQNSNIEIENIGDQNNHELEFLEESDAENEKHIEHSGSMTKRMRVMSNPNSPPQKRCRIDDS